MRRLRSASTPFRSILARQMLAIALMENWWKFCWISPDDNRSPDDNPKVQQVQQVQKSYGWKHQHQQWSKEVGDWVRENAFFFVHTLMTFSCLSSSHLPPKFPSLRTAIRWLWESHREKYLKQMEDLCKTPPLCPGEQDDDKKRQEATRFGSPWGEPA